MFGAERSILVRLKADVSDYSAKFTAAGVKAKDFARDVEGSSTKQRRDWDAIGTSVGAAGLAIGAAAAVAVKAFADFDKSMSRAAAGTDATVGEVNRLREAALAAGADTQFSATQAADAITELGKAGVAIPDILGGGLKGALDLAAAGELNVAAAAEIAATAMTQFRLAGEDLPHVADLLAAGAGKAQGSVQDLGLALSYVGPVAAGMGISIEETAGSVALLSSQGIIGEKAGTALRGMLSSLSSPSAKASEEMKRLGISLYDANGQFIGVAGAAEELQRAYQGMTAQQRDASLGILFGNEQLTAARVLYEGGGKAVQEWTARVDDAGFAARQAARLTDNLAGDFERFTGSLETALIGAGSGGNDALRTLTQTATGVVNAFNALPGPVQQSAVMLGGLSAAALLVSAGAIKATTGIVAMKASLGGLGVSATTASRGLRLVAGSIAGLTALQFLPEMAAQIDKSFGLVSDSATGMEKALKVLAETGTASGELADAFGTNFEGAGSAWNKFSLGFFTTGESLGSTVDRLTQKNDNLLESFWHWGDSTSTGAQNIKAVDQALADMVGKGNIDTAAAAFDEWAAGAGLQGEEIDKLLTLMPQYAAAMDDTAKQSSEADQASRELVLGVSDLGAEAEKARDAIDGLIEATKNYTNTALGARGSAREFEAALDAATDAADANGRTLDINTEKGRTNADALDAIASSGVAYAEATYTATGSTDQFNGILERTRAKLIDAAVRFGMTKSQARAYADSVLDIPSKAETKVALYGVDAANIQLERFRNNLGRIPGSKTVYLRTDASGLRPANGKDYALADGGKIPLGLGGPRQDNVPLWASSGEWMIRESSSRAAGDEALAELNAGRLVNAANLLLARSARGYADGGKIRALVPASAAFNTQRAIAVTVPATAGGGGPLVNVERLNLVEGSPDEVANDILFAIRQRGG